MSLVLDYYILSNLFYALKKDPKKGLIQPYQP